METCCGLITVLLCFSVNSKCFAVFKDFMLMRVDCISLVQILKGPADHAEQLVQPSDTACVALPLSLGRRKSTNHLSHRQQELACEQKKITKDFCSGHIAMVVRARLSLLWHPFIISGKALSLITKSCVWQLIKNLAAAPDVKQTWSKHYARVFKRCLFWSW